MYAQHLSSPRDTKSAGSRLIADGHFNLPTSGITSKKLTIVASTNDILKFALVVEIVTQRLSFHTHKSTPPLPPSPPPPLPTHVKGPHWGYL